MSIPISRNQSSLKLTQWERGDLFSNIVYCFIYGLLSHTYYIYYYYGIYVSLYNVTINIKIYIQLTALTRI